MATTKSGFMKTTEVADLLKCSSRTVQRLIASGELTAKRRGKNLLIEAWSVEAYIANLPTARGGK